eukprot:c18678_g1_i2.p1 GENE.c18678_g1_i2~~c18678_g1_i2.p1  ORF type:complete len:379 (+),score=135.82 c18678_g1_i2:20-1156(+)
MENEILRVNEVYCHLIIGTVFEEILGNEELIVTKTTEIEYEYFSIIAGDTRINLCHEHSSLRSTDNKYMLQTEDEFYEIEFDSSTPPNIIQEFEQILEQNTEFFLEQPDEFMFQPSQINSPYIETPTAPYSARLLANGIEKSSEYIAFGIVKTAWLVGKGLRKGSIKLCTRIMPSEEPLQVPERAITAITRTKQVASAANTATTVAVETVSRASQSVARRVAKQINKGGEQKEWDPNSRLTRLYYSKLVLGGMEVGRSTVTAFGNIYEGTINAGVILLQDSAEATSHVVRYKYGEDAGEATNDVTQAICDLGKAIQNTNRLKPNQILKLGAIDCVRESVQGQATTSPPIALTSSSVVPFTQTQEKNNENEEINQNSPI